VPSPPVLISVPGQVSRTKLLSVTVACEAGADLTVSAYGATLAAGTCAANERWQASFEVYAYPVPAGTAVTLSFAQSNIAGVSGAATAEVVIVD
jgi:hypothetical protein